MGTILGKAFGIYKLEPEEHALLLVNLAMHKNLLIDGLRDCTDHGLFSRYSKEIHLIRQLEKKLSI